MSLQSYDTNKIQDSVIRPITEVTGSGIVSWNIQRFYVYHMPVGPRL